MRKEAQIDARLLEVEHLINTLRDEALLEEFSLPASTAAYEKMVPLAPSEEPHGRSLTSSLIRMQIRGRAEGWLDCLHWVKGDPRYVRQHIKRHYRRRKQQP